MAGLVSAIHALLCLAAVSKTWMAATSAGMTPERRFDLIGNRYKWNRHEFCACYIRYGKTSEGHWIQFESDGAVR